MAHARTLRPAASLAVGAAAIAAAAGLAAAQPSVSVNLAGISVPSTGTSPPDVVRTSGAATISAAPGYKYTFNPTIQGTGLLGAVFIPSPKPLGDVLNDFNPGMYRVVYGAMRNPPGTVPTQVYFEPVGGTFSGLTLSLTLALDILADRTGRAGIRNITKPVFVGLNVTAGAATMEAWTPPAPVTTEWHFDGNLSSVKETGEFPASGPSKIRYLDDPAFGPILGGPGQETQYPNPATPTGVTQAQSSFGTTATFGLPAINGRTATVYKTSPTRNLADPGNRAKSRGLGLAMWPNTRDFWPDDKLASWTLIMDLYIPAAAWSAEYPLALFDNNHNNDASADAFIRQVAGQTSIGYTPQPGDFIQTSAIGPDQWMRLAISADSYRIGTSRIFVNGQFIGESDGGWVYNSTKSTDPRYADVSSTQPLGTAVPPATWSNWGSFPNPWVLAPNAANPAPMGSTVCLFADLQGRGESVYIANLLFTDDAMTDSQIAALAGPDARGIAFIPATTCPADADGNGAFEPTDIAVFISTWLGSLNAGTLAGDFDGNGAVEPADIATFIGAWLAGVQTGGC
ncbi:MAG: hypothetical protein KF745_13650 [Phycisphaeraceae bacterium]|nr:hypothetical protein [Phycisphaeraceae bacterium]